MLYDGKTDSSSSHHARQQQRLTELMATFQDPVVLIVSDVGGRDDVMYAKNRCVPKAMQPLVRLEDVFQGGCTAKNMVKVLKAIREKERLTSNAVPDVLLEGIAESAGGDVRHAVLQLEYAVRSSESVLYSRPAGAAARGASSAGAVFDFNLTKSSLCAMVGGLGASDENEEPSVGGAKRKGGPDAPLAACPMLQLVRGEDSDGHLLDAVAAGGTGGRVERRDARYSSLHSAGKIARAALDRRGQLAFDCDQVVYKSELDVELLIPFVQVSLATGERV